MPKISVSLGPTYGEPDPERQVTKEGEQPSDGTDSSQSSEKHEPTKSQKPRPRR
jgi:hypothetical protein